MAPLVPLDTAPETESDEAEAHSETPDGEQEEVFVNHAGPGAARASEH